MLLRNELVRVVLLHFMANSRLHGTSSSVSSRKVGSVRLSVVGNVALAKVPVEEPSSGRRDLEGRRFLVVATSGCKLEPTGWQVGETG